MRIILILLTLLCAGLQADERPLRFPVSDSWAMPLIQIEDGEAVGGILFELQNRLAAKVGRRAELIVMPRQRIQLAMERNDIDMRCYVTPDWLTGSHHQYVWSLPFVTQRDVLVARRPQTEPLHPEQLQNERIGAVLGFTYPSLQPLFDSGQLVREDARTQIQVLHKLQAGRYRYAVSNELSLQWYNKRLPARQRLHAVGEASLEPVSCIVRNAADVPTMALLRAMVQMRQSGEIDEILSHYR
ncbi:substrate-binding periplasmic protein [Pseudomonas borbori]